MTKPQVQPSAAGPLSVARRPSPTPAAGRELALPGSPFPLGATLRGGGTNFAVASAADGVLLCLFDTSGAETQIPLVDYDAGVWHGFLPGVGAGQAYGYPRLWRL